MLSGYPYTGIFGVLRSFYLHDSSLVNPDHLDTEFWNREDEASISAEDISDSDGTSVEILLKKFFFSFHIIRILECTDICRC
jgi:hypothetical protein